MNQYSKTMDSTKRDSETSNRTLKLTKRRHSTINEDNELILNELSDKISDQRYFELIDSKTGMCHGRYYALNPKQAANKMYTRMYQIAKLNNQHLDDTVIICLKESTKGSDRKIYAFEASRKKIEPISDPEIGLRRTLSCDPNNKVREISVPDDLIVSLNKICYENV